MKKLFVVLAVLCMLCACQANEFSFKFGHEYLDVETSMDFGNLQFGGKYVAHWYEYHRHYSSEDQFVGPFARLNILKVGPITGNIGIAYLMSTKDYGEDYWVPETGLVAVLNDTVSLPVSIMYCDDKVMFGENRFLIVAGVSVNF